MVLIKIFCTIILIYVSLFILVLILTKIFKYANIYFNNKEKETKIQKKENKKEVKKTWNEALKIWEIQD